MVNVACVQINSRDNLQENLDKIKYYIEQSAAQGAEFVLLPENAALMAKDPDQLVACACENNQHPLLALVSELCRRHSLWVLIGSVATKQSSSKRLLNRSYLYDDKGTLVQHYDKIHLYDAAVPHGETHRESLRFDPGSVAVKAPTPWGDLGMTVCYDVRFPLLYRQLAQQGVVMFAVPAAFTHMTGVAHWEVLLRARAIETGSYVLAPAQTGQHSTQRQTYGHSLIIDPWGRVLADGGEEEGIITASIDLADSARIRAQIPSLKDQEFSL